MVESRVEEWVEHGENEDECGVEKVESEIDMGQKIETTLFTS